MGHPATAGSRRRGARARGPVRLGASLLAWVCLAGSAAGGPPSREAELEAIRDEIMGLQVQLARVRQRQAGLEGELARLRLELELQEARLAEARTAGELAAGRLAATEAQVEELAVKLAEAREALRRSLSGLYRLGRQGYLRLLLSLGDEGELLPAIRQLRFLARRDSRAMERYSTTRVRLSFERDRLAAERREVEEWIRQEEARRRHLARLRRRQAVVLAEVERKRQRLAARAAELADKERKLSALLDFLYGRSTAPLAGTPIQNFRGVLDWPVRGRVMAGFGPRLDPRYKTRVPHNGIEIDTEPGAEVRAIFPGKVLFASPFQGYDWMAVLHHPGRVFSLYAGLSELEVSTEDMLSLGDVIGRAADSVYFEIRVENRPQDPDAWLR